MSTTTTDTHDALLSTDKAAVFLGVKVNTLAVWRTHKRFPELRYVRVGNLIKYRKSDILKWLEVRTVGVKD